MAYKNQKANKRHTAEMRHKRSHLKHARKKARYERRHQGETEREAYLRIGG